MERRHKFQLVGWALFTLCAVFYLTSAVINRDIYSMIGGTFFLVACFIFMASLFEEIVVSRKEK